MPRQTNIQIRRGTAGDWTSVNPTLANGEVAMETDTKKIKVGDGSTAWNSLQYVRADGGDLDGVPPANVFRAIPTMTSATTPSGVVSATSFATISPGVPSPGYEPFLAFDNNASTFASFDRSPSNTPRRTLQYTFPEGQKSAISAYSIASSDAFGYRANEWQFHGSDDGSTWTLLDTQTNQADSWQGSGSSSVTRTYSLSSPANYRMYRWTWSHADGGPGPNIISAQLVQ